MQFINTVGSAVVFLGLPTKRFSSFLLGSKHLNKLLHHQTINGPFLTIQNKRRLKFVFVLFDVFFRLKNCVTLVCAMINQDLSIDRNFKKEILVI